MGAVAAGETAAAGDAVAGSAGGVVLGEPTRGAHAAYRDRWRARAGPVECEEAGRSSDLGGL